MGKIVPPMGRRSRLGALLGGLCLTMTSRRSRSSCPSAGTTEEALEFYLTAQDPEIGNPRDGDRLVQRFCWFLLDASKTPERPRLDLSLTSLLKPDGSLSPMGVTFRDTVRRILEEFE